MLVAISTLGCRSAPEVQPAGRDQLIGFWESEHPKGLLLDSNGRGTRVEIRNGKTITSGGGWFDWKLDSAEPSLLVVTFYDEEGTNSDVEYLQYRVSYDKRTDVDVLTIVKDSTHEGEPRALNQILVGTYRRARVLPHF